MEYNIPYLKLRERWSHGMYRPGYNHVAISALEQNKLPVSLLLHNVIDKISKLPLKQ